MKNAIYKPPTVKLNHPMKISFGLQGRSVSNLPFPIVAPVQSVMQTYLRVDVYLTYSTASWKGSLFRKNQFHSSLFNLLFHLSNAKFHLNHFSSIHVYSLCVCLLCFCHVISVRLPFPILFVVFCLRSLATTNSFCTWLLCYGHVILPFLSVFPSLWDAAWRGASQDPGIEPQLYIFFFSWSFFYLSTWRFKFLKI